MSEIIKNETKMTTNYGLFSRSQINREINWGHVNRLADSIKSKNLLFMRPIEVNKEMEILDGQHRLEAARKLQIPIYFRITDKMTMDDVGIINAAQKSWGPVDFFNFYCAKNYPEYLKMKKYMSEEGINFSCAYALDCNRDKDGILIFRNGDYKCHLATYDIHIKHARETLDWACSVIGFKAYLKGGRCFKSLVLFLKHASVDYDKFRRNLESFVMKLLPFRSQTEYLNFYIEVLNFRSSNKISLEEFMANENHVAEKKPIHFQSQNRKQF